MTLHWWMHWFWITAQVVVSLTSPTSERSAGVAGVLESATTTTTQAPGVEDVRLQQTTETLARLQQSYRIAKAAGAASSESPRQPPSTEAPRSLQIGQIATAAPPVGPDRLRPISSTVENKTIAEGLENKTTRIPSKKETKITWVHAYSKPTKPKYEEKTTSTTPYFKAVSPEDLTVMPLQEAEQARPKSLDPNAIHRDQQLSTATHSAELLLEEETGEPHVIATAASVLEAGLGDSTRLGRARGTFTSEFQRDQLSREEHHAENKEEMIKETAEASANVTEIATITGSCLAIIILLSTVGSLGFIMYRRKYLNPPQTLNSDKYSNPDSSGYIDDSTIRDNSEEMYSLDNDSFLNSLEAMTIQNYWTDSVKHTKL